GRAAEKELVEPLLRFAKIQELHFVAIFADGVIDELDELIGPGPAVWMENEIEHTLLQHRHVEGCLPIGYSDRIGRSVQVMRFPIARDCARKFPAAMANYVGIRIVANRGHK